MTKQEFIQQINRYLEGNSSDDEAKELENYYESFQTESAWNTAKDGDIEFVGEHIRQILEKKIRSKRKENARVFVLRKWAVAASVILLAGIGGYFWIIRNEQPVTVSSGLQKPDIDVSAPSANRASITLADGKKVFLDSAGPGELAMQGAVKIVKLQNGKVIYQNQKPVTKIEYNTVSNPRGSRVQMLTLADGTQVWLNAASTLKFPTAFINGERKLEITGEAYFSVVHNAAMPFKVVANGLEVKDLGTEFNINSYEDEPQVKVTLVNGLLAVSKNGIDHNLLPSQEASVNEKVKIKSISEKEVESVVDWRRGFFSFSQADLQTVLRQLSRWYDVNIVFERNALETYKQEFTGRIGMKLSLRDLLDGLSSMRIRFKIEPGKLTIMP